MFFFTLITWLLFAAGCAYVATVLVGAIADYGRDLTDRRGYLLVLPWAKVQYGLHTLVSVHHARLAERLDPHRSHLMSVALGLIDYDCQDLAADRAGWWDWDVSCAGHRCGFCDECTARGFVRSPYALGLRIHAHTRRILTRVLDRVATVTPRRLEPGLVALITKVDPGQDHRLAHVAGVECLECFLKAYLLLPKPSEGLFDYLVRSIAAEVEYEHENNQR